MLDAEAGHPSSSASIAWEANDLEDSKIKFRFKGRSVKCHVSGRVGIFLGCLFPRIRGEPMLIEGWSVGAFPSFPHTMCKWLKSTCFAALIAPSLAFVHSLPKSCKPAGDFLLLQRGRQGHNQTETHTHTNKHKHRHRHRHMHARTHGHRHGHRHQHKHKHKRTCPRTRTPTPTLAHAPAPARTHAQAAHRTPSTTHHRPDTTHNGHTHTHTRLETHNQ